jgi:hypothetical protein
MKMPGCACQGWDIGNIVERLVALETSVRDLWRAKTAGETERQSLQRLLTAERERTTLLKCRLEQLARIASEMEL